MNEMFHKVAKYMSGIIGSGLMFVVAFLLIIGWALSGPFFNYSDTWQLFINTTTTVITFLTVILIQNTQNRDAKALHLKLDELIRTHRMSRNQLLALENMTEKELDVLEVEFEKLRDESLKKNKK